MKNFEQALAQLSIEVTQAFNRGDISACLSYYAEDAMVLLPNVAPLKGSKAIEAFLREYITAGAKLTPVHPIEIHSSGEIGYCVGTYQFKMPTTSESSLKEVGKYVTVFKRQTDGSWKAVLDALIRDTPSGS